MNDREFAELALSLAEAGDPRTVGETVAQATSATTWLLGAVSAQTLRPLAAAPQPPGPEVPYRPADSDTDVESRSPRLAALAAEAGGPLHLRGLGGDGLWIANQPLEERAAPLVAAALERVLAAESEPSHFRDRALSTISHDLRGPLNVIGFAGSMLESSVGDAEKELVGKIRRAARQMEGMIRDLLDLGEIEAGRLELQSGDTDVKTVMGHLEAAATPLTENASVSWSTEIEDAEAPLVADASRLAQALALLVDSACRHAKKGSVTARTGSSSDGPFFEIEDSGKPLDAATRASLFVPSSRGAEPHPRAKGLGLTLARRLIEAHGGRLEALESDGVRIRATLPPST